jgi:hypothetical protein
LRGHFGGLFGRTAEGDQSFCEFRSFHGGNSGGILQN